MVPMPGCLHLHKGVCVCVCLCPHIYYILDIKILILHVKRGHLCDVGPFYWDLQC